MNKSSYKRAWEGWSKANNLNKQVSSRKGGKEGGLGPLCAMYLAASRSEFPLPSPSRQSQPAASSTGREH